MTAALQRHNLTPYQDAKGTWKLEPTGTRMTWREDDYAAALNSLPPGNLLKRHEGVEMTLDGQDVTVPLGQWLNSMRSKGRKKELGQELTAALQRHNLTPYQDTKGTWKLEPTGTRMTWREDDYAAALNSLPPGNPPKQHDGVNMTLDGQDVTVPLGQWLNGMRSKGRKKELGQELTSALQRHNLTPYQDTKGTWKLPSVRKPADGQAEFDSEPYQGGLTHHQEFNTATYEWAQGAGPSSRPDYQAEESVDWSNWYDDGMPGVSFDLPAAYESQREDEQTPHGLPSRRRDKGKGRAHH